MSSEILARTAIQEDESKPFKGDALLNHKPPGGNTHLRSLRAKHAHRGHLQQKNEKNEGKERKLGYIKTKN